MEKEGLTLKLNQKISTAELTATLINLGYENIQASTPNKEREFGRRGNLIDIWLERYKLPVRIDLISNKIENIYLFNYFTQIKVKNLKEIYIVPFGVTPKIAPKWTKRITFPSGGGKIERLFLSEIEAGDLVVHIDHGIGRFLGIGRLALSPSQFLVVEYARGDKLYVPVGQIERLTKYIGIPGYKPKLATLGGSGWERIKQKVAQSLLEVARDLLLLYARREIVNRTPYSPDTPWQKELETSFEYQETADQIKATKEIKEDLETTKPMDRILVGDVGFGKTEVAIRAAFKVVQEGKQVVVLVPTTILAAQHYQLFSQRLKSFPVKVEILSRFCDEKAQKIIVEKLKQGSIDIIIGTQRLLSPDVQFKNLGLLIIDEEHRFGVAAKEKLKSLRTSVDILSMSATPIPRTLHMSFANLRDISVLKEAPKGRQPIKTFVGKYDERKVKEAISKELFRGGQVYYVFNNVAAIARKAGEVASLIPKAKVVYVHGQKREPELAAGMEQFYSGKADVLVCTTIIGSGLDMPNVNTILIEDAHRFGLADLHQLRGRVGRSERQAYAYLFYPKGYVPIASAFERLAIIGEKTELGAGFKIAKKDLEIRGAGNLLGTAQSGNISLVGFELYVQLLSQAVERIKKEGRNEGKERRDFGTTTN